MGQNKAPDERRETILSVDLLLIINFLS